MWKKEILRWSFSRISRKKFQTPTFLNTFCWLLSLRGKNNKEEELKCLLHTALTSNAFLNEHKDERKQFSLKSVRSEGTKWKIQYLLKLKTELVSFVFGFRYQVSGKNKNKRFRMRWIYNPSNLPQQFLLLKYGPRSRGAKGVIATPISWLPQRQ